MPRDLTRIDVRVVAQPGSGEYIPRASPMNRSRVLSLLPFLLFVAPLAPACSSSKSSDAAPPGATVMFDPDAQFGAENAFFDFPYPSDLRLNASGAPDLESFPNPDVSILVGLKKTAQERRGFPVVPAGYFKLTAKPVFRDPEVLVEGGLKAPLLLIDVDPTSPERGTAYPVVAQTPNADPYVPENLVAVAGIENPTLALCRVI